MANAIYTTDSKAMTGATGTKSVVIPNPEANQNVHTIIAVNNGNVGGLFATVLHSYDGTNYKYKLYFLPNRNFNDSLIFANLPGSSDVIEFKKTTRLVEKNRFWYLLQKNVQGSAISEFFLVNDITKIQGTTTNAVSTSTRGVGVPQDILAAFYNNKKNVLLIKDILSVDTTVKQNVDNLTAYVGKNFTTSIDKTSKKYNIQIRIANFDEKYLFTQAKANQEHNTAYATGSSESKYYNFESSQAYPPVLYDPSFPLAQTQSRRRYGLNRKNLFFRESWMKVKAHELYSDILDDRMRLSLIPSLREFIKHINATVANTAAKEQEVVAKESLAITGNTLDNKIKRDTTEAEKKNFSNQQNAPEILLIGERDLNIYLSYGKPPAANYEHVSSTSELYRLLNSSSESTIGSADVNPEFVTSNNYASKISRTFGTTKREAVLGTRTQTYRGGINSEAFRYWRAANPGLPYSLFPGSYTKRTTYVIKYITVTKPDRGYLTNFLNFSSSLPAMRSPTTTRISDGYYSPGQAEVVKLLQDNFSASRNFKKIPLRTYEITQKEKYTKLDVQTFSIPGNAASYPTRRFATRDNSENVYIVDEKTDSKTIILKVI